MKKFGVLSGRLMMLCMISLAPVTGAVAQVPGKQPQVGELVGYQDMVTCLAMSADASIAISGGTDGLICVWDLPSRKYIRTMHGHSKALSRVAITPDGKRAVSSGMDGKLVVWDVTTGEMLSKVDFNFLVYCCAISDDGKFAAGGAHNGDLKFVDVDQDKVVSVLHHEQRIWALALNADGSRLAAGRCRYTDTPASAPDGSVTMYNTATKAVEANIESIHNCSMLKFVDRGTKLQYFSAPESWGWVDLATLKLTRRQLTSEYSLDFCSDMPADGSSVFVAHRAGTIDQVLPTDQGQQHRKLPGNTGTNNAVAVSPDGRTVLVGGFGRVTGPKDGFPARHAGAVAVLQLDKN